MNMRNTDADREVAEKVHRAASDELRQFVERVEKLNQEKDEISTLTKEVLAEAKARGYDVKVLKRVVAMRKQDPDVRAEEQAVLDLYLDALGM